MTPIIVSDSVYKHRFRVRDKQISLTIIYLYTLVKVSNSDSVSRLYSVRVTRGTTTTFSNTYS